MSSPVVFHAVEARPGVIQLFAGELRAEVVFCYCPYCGETDTKGFDYMLLNSLWEKYAPAPTGMLCLGCLVFYMGRPLVREDFRVGCAPGEMFHSKKKGIT